MDLIEFVGKRIPPLFWMHRQNYCPELRASFKLTQFYPKKDFVQYVYPVLFVIKTWELLQYSSFRCQNVIKIKEKYQYFQEICHYSLQPDLVYDLDNA